MIKLGAKSTRRQKNLLNSDSFMRIKKINTHYDNITNSNLQSHTSIQPQKFQTHSPQNERTTPNIKIKKKKHKKRRLS